MHRYLLVHSLLTCIILNTQSQNWVEHIGGSERDVGIHCVLDDEESLIATGYFNGRIGFGSDSSITLSSLGSRDVFLVKYNNDKNLLWAVNMGGTGGDMARRVAVDDSNNIYITGYYFDQASFSQTGDDPVIVETAGGPGIFLAKYSPGGSVIWARSLHSPEYTGSIPESNGLCYFSGNLYITGSYYDNLDFDPGAGELISPIASDTSGDGKSIFFASYNSDGILNWARTLNARQNQTAHEILVDRDINIYITGAIEGNVDFDPGPDTNLLSAAKGSNAFLAKYSANGDYFFARNISWGTSEGLINHFYIADTLIYVAGYFQGNTYSYPDTIVHTHQNLGNRDIFFGCCNTDGDLIWINYIGSTGEDYPADILTDSWGRIVLIGSFSNSADFDPSPEEHFLQSQAYKDIFIASYNSAGDFLSAQKISSSGQSTFGAMDYSGVSFYTIGNFEGSCDLRLDSPDPNLITSHGNADFFLMSFIDYGEYVQYRTSNICEGDSILLQGEYQHKAGRYLDTILSDGEPDSLIITDLHLISTTFERDLSICQGDSMLLEGLYRSDPGTYFDTISHPDACDSILITKLVVNPKYTDNQSISICEHDSVFLEGEFQKTEGLYYNSYESVSGCDSVILTNLTVNPVYKSIRDLDICDTDSVFFSGRYLNDPGMYIDILATAQDCDSAIIMNLDIIETPQLATIQFIAPNTLFSNIGGNGISYSWYLNDTLLDDTTQYITAIKEGEYNVIVARGICHSNPSVAYLFETDAIQGLQQQALTIMPNPGSGIFRLNIDGSTGAEVRVSVYNILGKEVFSRHLYHYKPMILLDLSRMENGLYHIVLDDNIKRLSGRLIIRK